MDAAFPTDEEIDFSQLVKIYGPETICSGNEKKYSQVECTGSKKTVIYSQPDEKFIFTNYVERQKPDNEDAHAQVHPLDQLFQQKNRKPRLCNRSGIDKKFYEH